MARHRVGLLPTEKPLQPPLGKSFKILKTGGLALEKLLVPKERGLGSHQLGSPASSPPAHLQRQVRALRVGAGGDAARDIWPHSGQV